MQHILISIYKNKWCQWELGSRETHGGHSFKEMLRQPSKNCQNNNIIETMENSQRFIATKWMLNQGKKWLESRGRALWHFNLPLPHSPPFWLSGSLEDGSLCFWCEFLVLEGAEQSLFSKNCCCLFRPVGWLPEELTQGACLHFIWLGILSFWNSKRQKSGFGTFAENI